MRQNSSRYICEWCGAEVSGGVCPWSIACPDCRVGPGVWCKRPSGHDAAEMHAQRYLTAEGMGEPGRQRSLLDLMGQSASAQRDEEEACTLSD